MFRLHLERLVSNRKSERLYWNEIIIAEDISWIFFFCTFHSKKSGTICLSLEQSNRILVSSVEYSDIDVIVIAFNIQSCKKRDLARLILHRDKRRTLQPFNLSVWDSVINEQLGISVRIEVVVYTRRFETFTSSKTVTVVKVFSIALRYVALLNCPADFTISRFQSLTEKWDWFFQISSTDYAIPVKRATPRNYAGALIS